VLINGRDIPITFVGIRPGEKTHEILVSEEECHRTIERDGYYVICPILPELRRTAVDPPTLTEEYSSEHTALGHDALRALLSPYLEARLEGIQA
jgi:UDP-glucose 4-epimerase